MPSELVSREKTRADCCVTVDKWIPPQHPRPFHQLRSPVKAALCGVIQPIQPPPPPAWYRRKPFAFCLRRRPGGGDEDGVAGQSDGELEVEKTSPEEAVRNTLVVCECRHKRAPSTRKRTQDQTVSPSSTSHTNISSNWSPLKDANCGGSPTFIIKYKQLHGTEPCWLS